MEEDQPSVNLMPWEAIHKDENPEEHIGAELIDPWVDPEQTDWPNAEDVEIRQEPSDD